ncbi:hypothetical protein LCGC14_0560850 [marine sediment metagenome]|uniref:Large polyvalent protein associated domain-containing protein n=1 Tax=marine sediment metagenome TaxID=412755 RepID=A0A0F9RS38_9ZZZZ
MVRQFVWQPKADRLQGDLSEEWENLSRFRAQSLAGQDLWNPFEQWEGLGVGISSIIHDPKRFGAPYAPGEAPAYEDLPEASIGLPFKSPFTGEQARLGTKGAAEFIPDVVALAGAPSGVSAFRALGKAAKGVPLAEQAILRTGQAAIAPLAAAERVIPLAARAAASPIRALVERRLQLPEKTVTASIEQWGQYMSLARKKNLLVKSGPRKRQPTKSFRNLMELYTGKTSRKDLTRADADRLIEAFGQLEVVGTKPPKIPKVTALMSKEFWDNIPYLKDVGFVDYVRQRPQILRMLGIDDVADDLLKEEVALMTEKQAFLEELSILKQSLGRNSATRGARVFDALENPLETHLLDPDEQKIFIFARRFFDQWADALKIPAKDRRKNYITHIFDRQFALDDAQKKTLPLDVLKALEFNYPKKTYMPFLKERFGASIGLKKDPFAAMQVYESYALKNKYYQPLLQKISAYVSMFEARGKMTSANYLKDMARRISGRPTKEDLLINESIGTFARTMAKIPGFRDKGGLRLEELAKRGNIGALVAHNLASIYYMSWLGFRPVSAIRNLSQQLLTAADIGFASLGKGIGLRFTAEGKSALKESLVLQSRKLGQPVAGLEDEVLSRMPQRLQRTALAMFKFADKQNVSDAFLAGYSRAKTLGLPREWAIRYGDEVAMNTQYLYTKMSRSLFEDTTAGRLLSPFTSWTRNFIELLAKWGQGRQSIVLQQYAKATGKQVVAPKRDMKSLYTYMAILTGAYVTEGATALRAVEYTGWTSISGLGRILGGDLPALQLPAGIFNIVGGAMTGDERQLKEGWNDIRPDKFIQIIKQLEDIAEGKADILSLFMYLERQEMNQEEGRIRPTPGRERPERTRERPKRR